MKTVLLATGTDYEAGRLTGAHKRVIELITGLSMTCRIILVSGYIPQLSEVNNIKRIKISVSKIGILPHHISECIHIMKGLKQVRHEKIDCAISFGPTITCVYARAGIKPIVTLMREDYVEYNTIFHKKNFTLKLRYSYFYHIEKKMIKHSIKIIVQCKNDADKIIMRHSNYNNLSDKLSIQINNINTFWNKADTPKIVNKKAQYENINSKSVQIGFIGSFGDERKGHAILLPAIKKILDEGYLIILHVAGEGKELEKLKVQYRNYKEIIFWGQVNEIRDFLSQMDILIVPSLMDSCPNTVLEGIMAEVAVYGSNVGGIPDLLQNEKYIFKPDSAGIYEFIKDLLDSKKYLTDLERQHSLIDILTFDWSEKIRKIIFESI